jgi:hypothetical protein
MLKVMGAGPTGRITYAAGGRLDGIGRRAIGDMRVSSVTYHPRLRTSFEATSEGKGFAGMLFFIQDAR